MEKQVNSGAVLISAVFGTRQHVHSRKVFRSKTFKELVLKSRKGLASEHFSGIKEFPGSKHFWKKHGNTSKLFLQEYETT